MPFEQDVRSGRATTGERDDDEIAEERGDRDGDRQRDRCAAMVQGEQCGGDHETAAGQKRQQRVADHGGQRESGDEPRLGHEGAQLDLHASIVSNVQRVVNKVKNLILAVSGSLMPS
ncbi:hypothetical protein [Streptomyces sp. NPDC096105]|uniref:hypothetical protein n=1 Tax=Streptomyces sp. NPDC096105 TaxID=3366074 RepID=UPI003805DE35